VNGGWADKIIIIIIIKFTGDLQQLNQKNDVQNNEIQHTKAKWGEVLKKKWKNKAIHTEYR
jgi:hypothetical protein